MRRHDYFENNALDRIDVKNFDDDGRWADGFTISRNGKEKDIFVFKAYSFSEIGNTLKFDFDQEDIIYPCLDKFLSDKNYDMIKEDGHNENNGLAVYIFRNTSCISMVFARTEKSVDDFTITLRDTTENTLKMKERLRTLVDDYKKQYIISNEKECVKLK